MREKGWVNPRHLALYELCGHALRHAFEEGFVCREDIWGSDDDLWAKLQDAARRRRSIAELIDRLVAGAEFVQTSQEKADISARAKVRWIDPEVAINGDIVPLSTLSTDYAEVVSQYRRLNSEIVHLRMA